MADEQERIDARISGEVQGVFYRATTRETAQSLGVKGWVKNLSDGTVRLVAEGPKSRLEELVEWAHEGSPAARVEDVDVDWSDATGEFSDFHIER
ncbi:MAG: acylphosphatase [Myxococcota bacterium]